MPYVKVNFEKMVLEMEEKEKKVELEEMFQIVKQAIHKLNRKVNKRLKIEEMNKKIKEQFELDNAGYKIVSDMKTGDDLIVQFKRKECIAQLIKFTASGVLVKIDDEIKSVKFRQVLKLNNQGGQ